MEVINTSSHVHNGLRLHLSKTNKFKTISILLMMHAPLQEDVATARALIPYVLNGGTKKYPNRKLIKQKLDGMYGSKIFYDIQKKSNNHVISFSLEIPANQFLNTTDSLLEEALDILNEIIFHPILENDVFQSSIVEQEKGNLKQRHAAMYDEKLFYAHNRLIEEMFEGEPYHYPTIGKQEDIDLLNASTVYRAYEELLKNARYDLYMVGNFNEIEVKQKVQKIFSSQYNTKPIQTNSRDSTGRTEIKIIEDKMEVQQGKLLIGYRTYSTIKDKDFEATSIANAIFGRFPFSKLFREIREKENLAYFAHSQLEIHKGFLITMVGIDFDNYDRAVDLIRKQEYAMKSGDFTEEELEQGKAMLINLFLEAQDTPLGIIDTAIQGVESGLPHNIENKVKRIRNVSKTDIVRSVNKWSLDTVYFLNRSPIDKI